MGSPDAAPAAVVLFLPVFPPMNNDRYPAADLPADESEIVGIVVQGVPHAPARPHLAFVWGPEPVPAPSLPFGRARGGVRAA